MKFAVCLIGLALFQSCIFIRQDDSLDLGGNYKLIQENPKVIIYNTSPTSKSSGVNIVPPIVLSHDFNDQYIIAKSQEKDEMTGDKEGRIRYWIIDKSQSGKRVESQDSVSFYNELKLLNIKLQLQEE